MAIQADYALDDCFPPEHIIEYAEKSLRISKPPSTSCIFTCGKTDGRPPGGRRPSRCSNARERGGGCLLTEGIRKLPRNYPDRIVDATVIYNIFDQAPKAAVSDFAGHKASPLLRECRSTKVRLRGLSREIRVPGGDGVELFVRKILRRAWNGWTGPGSPCPRG